jgi:glycosyltransferase involved in cell wall biosynthesis
VVASAVPGVREILEDGIDGRLVAAKDAQSLCDALVQLLQNPDQAARLASAGRKKACEHFSRDRMNQDYEALFLALAAQATTGGAISP